MKSEPGPPMTLGAAGAAGLGLIVWCKACRHQVEPDPAAMVERYGAETTLLDWAARPGPRASSLAAIERAFDEAGVMFLEVENTKEEGEGSG